MKSRGLARLGHMLESVQAILSYIQGKNRQDLDDNRLLRAAITREFEILGEAANQISKKTKELFADIPWKQIIGMRNQLIHVYFDIDQEIVWKTATKELPLLSSILTKAIQEFSHSSN